MNLKGHKDPLGSRFVAGGTNAPLRQLSLALLAVFRLLSEDIHLYWESTFRNHDAPAQFIQTSSWIIQSSRELGSLIDQLNLSIPKTELRQLSCSTEDFTTLYTMLLLKTLIKRLSKLVKKLFLFKSLRNNNHTFHIIFDASTNKAVWTTLQPKKPFKPHTFFLDPPLIKVWIDKLVTNTDLTFGDLVFTQVIGITMGTN
jgi:hypothetical protein